MRGDRPSSRVTGPPRDRFTPHARGSTLSLELTSKVFTVYPACAGIDQWFRVDRDQELSLPRMRGDRPLDSL